MSDGIKRIAGKMADYLYDVAEDGAADIEKTAKEVEAEMREYIEAELARELGPLLEAASDAQECLEECAMILAEVHVRFGAMKMLGEEADRPIEATYGDAAKMYEGEAKTLKAALVRFHSGAGKEGAE